jgi:hypothetical protein
MAETDVAKQLTAEMTQALSQSLIKIGQNLQGLDRISKDVTSSSGGIGRLDATIAGMATRILGPVGLVAGLWQISSALSNVASQSVQMQAFARNTGLATDSIKNMQLQLQMIGQTSEQAKATVGQLAGTLNDFNTNQRESGLDKNFRSGRGAGGVEFLNELKTAAGNAEKQIEIVKKWYSFQRDDRERRGFLEGLNVQGLGLAEMEELLKDGGRISTAFKKQTDAMNQYHRDTVVFKDNMSETWNAISGNIISEINKLTGGLEGAGSNFEAFAKGFNWTTTKFFDVLRGQNESMAADVKAAWKWMEENSGNAYKTKPKMLEYGPDHGPLPLGSEYGPDHGPLDETTKWWQMKGKLPTLDLRRNGGTSGATDFGGMRRTQSIEEDQSKTLVDIRDILQRMEGGSGSGGGGGGSYPGSAGVAGGGRGSLGARLGMYGGNGTAGVGAERGKVARGGDPRGMEGYIRETAAKYGIDPDTAVAVAKSEGLSTFQSSVPRTGKGSLNGREASFGAFQLYTGGGLGNEWQAANPGLDITDPANEKSTIDFALKHAARKGWGSWNGAKNTGIGPWAGIGRNGVSPQPGGDERASPFSGMSFGGDVRERQRAVAGTRKGDLNSNLRTAFDYASSRTGLTVDVTSGGQRMSGAPGWKGSHRHDDGNAADFNLRDENGNIVSPNDPRALEFYRYAAQGGVTGGGAQYMRDPNKIHLDRSGGVYAGSREFRAAIARGRTETEEFTTAARARMDAAKNSGTENSLKATIDFNNVPPGVKTSVEKEGEIFKELQVQKSRQNEVAGGSPGQPFSGVW